MDITLLAVPLHPGSAYIERLKAGLEVLSKHSTIETLIFGDLHLEHIKEWRDTQLAQLGVPLSYPLWKISYRELYADLMRSKVPCVLSSCIGSKATPILESIEKGHPFDDSLLEKLQQTDWDIFGENGEFHTIAQVWKVSKEQALGTK